MTAEIAKTGRGPPGRRQRSCCGSPADRDFPSRKAALTNEAENNFQFLKPGADKALNRRFFMELDLAKYFSMMKEKRASDLHLKAGTPPVIRKTRFLQLLDPSFPRVANQDLRAAFNRILTPHQKTILEENKQLDFSYGISGLGRFRINVFFQRGTLRAVIRYIPVHVPSFESLNLPPKIKKITDRARRGLILVTGATGMGKSTTVAAMLNQINQTKNRHIITIEDPIEFLIKDNKSLVTQRELGVDSVNYQMALKASLRQDPDILFFGELRDAESAEIALNAANTGHLVLSTLHTNNAAETITRVLGFFSKEKQAHVRMEFSSCLRVVICQKLLVQKHKRGFVPAVEILLNTPRVRELLEDPEQSTSKLPSVIENGRDGWGMQSFNQHLIQLCNEGKITEEAAFKASDSPEKLKLYFSGLIHENKNAKHLKFKPKAADSKKTMIAQDIIKTEELTLWKGETPPSIQPSKTPFLRRKKQS